MKYILDILLFINKHLDKIAHIFFGLILFFGLFMIIRDYTFTFMVVVVISFFKELFDYQYVSRKMDLRDFISTIFGGILGLLMWIVK